ncbi:MAG: site-specific integrase [Gallionella sp.]|nr:site-specific integrase [Gallionella sp.]
MNNAVEQFIAERDALPLPKITRTRSGIEFYPADMHWNFRDGTLNISINFSLLPEACSPMLAGLKHTLIWYFENRAPKTVCGNFTDIVWIMRVLAEGKKGKIDRINPDDIASVMTLSAKAEYRLARIRGFLSKWSELGYLGVSKDVVSALNRLAPKQNPVGVAVATLDPKNGPLTDLEFEGIQIALNNAYAKSEIGTEQILLCYLLMALGVRPVQIASLKCIDLIVPQTPDGDYFLKVPRAKQTDQLTRSEFKLRKLTRQLGEPLSAYAQLIQSDFVNCLPDVREFPLFPQRRDTHYADAPGFEHHSTAYAISSRVIKIFSKLSVPSERLTEAIPMNAIRFRRTFATRAAEEGWSLLVLAELMDHANTKNVQVYAGLTSRVRAQFSRKIAMDMAPLAMWFSGKIIRQESEATRPGLTSRIIDLRVDHTGASMGSCGSYVHCGFARPIACYSGCLDFEPWLDGPHEAAMDYMLARREMLMATTDARIATVNDRAILGCAQIILRCREALAEEKHD